MNPFSGVHASDANLEVSPGLVDANGPAFGGAKQWGPNGARDLVEMFITRPLLILTYGQLVQLLNVSGLNGSGFSRYY